MPPLPARRRRGRASMRPWRRLKKWPWWWWRPPRGSPPCKVYQNHGIGSHGISWGRLIRHTHTIYIYILMMEIISQWTTNLTWNWLVFPPGFESLLVNHLTSEWQTVGESFEPSSQERMENEGKKTHWIHPPATFILPMRRIQPRGVKAKPTSSMITNVLGGTIPWPTKRFWIVVLMKM